MHGKLWFMRFVFLFLFSFSLTAYGQLNLSKDSISYLLSKTPAFSIYKDNYFITGTSISEKPTSQNSDAKIMISFKQRIQNKPVFFDSYLYFFYTQKSFWDIYRKSRPFDESNYNPGLMLVKPLFKSDRFKGLFSLSLEHESNGRDSIYSRSWNYVGLNYSHIFSEKITAAFKIIVPIEKSDNRDLNKYIGYTELQGTWNIKKDLLILDLSAKKGASWSAKGSIMTTLSYRPTKNRNLYYTIQYWQGRAESLIDYTKSTSMLRIGFIVKPSNLRFY